ncbi:MAG: branched-chain amino acid ABC transporter permease [Thermoleophilia bacterium]|nr:branched-chain amino acid ABC transporter permease [Thermoleophilia bacterium]
MTERAFSVVRTSGRQRIGLGVLVVIVAVGASVPLWASTRTARTLISFLTLLAFAEMWNLLGGYAGMVSVGQQAYIGIGAYSLWFFSDRVGLQPFLGVPIAGVIAALIAVPTAVLVFRLRGGYFAIGTWVVAETYRLILSNNTGSGGGTGVTVTSASQMGQTMRLYGTYWMALVVAVGAILIVYFLLRSRTGLALTSIRDNEVASQSLGVRVWRTKLWVYVLSAFGFGAAGAVAYLNLLRIQPDAAFSINWTAYTIFIVVIGGVGSIEGPIIGTIVYFSLQETLAKYGSWYLVLLGVIAIAITTWSPGGIWGFVQRHWNVQLFPVHRGLRLAEAVGPPEDSAVCAVDEPSAWQGT